jgi:hypothetical protein
MAKKKAAKKKSMKKKAPKKRIVAKKAIAKAANKKATTKKAVAKRAAAKPAAKKKAALKAIAQPAAARNAAPKKPAASAPRRPARRQSGESSEDLRGLGYGSAGQSGATQGLSTKEVDDSESVEELVEEGQAWEASAIAGVEDADGDPKEVRTHEVPEDDVPEEYLNDRENE